MPPLQNSYALGGFLNLSRYAEDELAGQYKGVARPTTTGSHTPISVPG